MNAADNAVDYFPIRVVSQRTGVNTVTLRAWERRYGLLQPVRTAKGHRLYTGEDIARIVRIVDWLNRGMSIGRVRGLLERDADAGEALAGPETADWDNYVARITRAVALFDETRLDETINEALALYPFVTVCERLLSPLQHNPGERWQGRAGDAAERVFVDGYLRRKLAARVQFGSRHLAGAPVLLACLPGAADTSLLMLAAGLIGLDQPVLLLDAPLPAEELVVAGERLRPRALLVHGDTAVDAAVLGRWLQRLVEAHLAPVFVAGPVAQMQEALVSGAGARPLADGSLAAAARRLVLMLEPEELP